VTAQGSLGRGGARRLLLPAGNGDHTGYSDAPVAQPKSEAAVRSHLDSVLPALESLRNQSCLVAAWGEELARRLQRGARLLAAGNGGSAAEAQHLTAELVGRFDGERVPFSAISLHAETSAVTAIANDYGFEQLFARQVRAHGRAGDVLILLSTSGRSPNLLRAVEAARKIGVTTWALTGPGPNPLALTCDEAVTIDAPAASAQECHLIALHAICRAFDAEILRRGPFGAAP
jgi:D-sedoheptulose 7-phosphate isomerase